MTQTGPLVLIVEDELQMRRFLRACLGSHGYQLVEAGTAEEATRLATARNPGLILLDLGLPDRDGLELTREFRAWTKTPIIVLSARGREEDKVEALDAGADVYLPKPFGANELLARLRVALRHAGRDETAEAPPVVEVGELRIDLPRREVTVAGRAVRLTPIEFNLLVLLARHAGKVLTHRQILKEIWGPNVVTQTHYVRVHMAELRKKVEADPARPRLLLSEPGVGYRMAERP